MSKTIINLACVALGFVLQFAVSPDADAQLSDGRFASYSLQHVAPDEVRRMLIDLLGQEADSVEIFCDAQKKQLMVSGSKRAQELASELVKQIDQPAPKAAPLPEKPMLKTYEIPQSQIERRLTAIRQMAGSEARVTVDRDRGQVIVVAGKTAHQRLQKALNKTQATPAQPAKVVAEPISRPVPAAPPAMLPKKLAPKVSIPVADPETLFPGRPSGNVALRSGTMEYRLRGITATQCQKALRRLLGDRLWDLGDGHFRYSANDTRQLKITLDSDRHTCRLEGEQELVEQLVKLLNSFEASQKHAGDEAYRFVPLNNVRPDVLQRAIRVWRQSSKKPKVLDGVEQSYRMPGHSTIQTVGFLQDEPAGQPPSNGDAVEDAAADGSDEDALRRPSADVDVQPLPGLDVLILRGRDPDVEELVRIIQEIERLSDETAPEVDIYFLKNVHGQSINTIINSVLSELTGTLQGRISITPLVKPNALLLIGWGEAVEAAKKLINKLDRPVEPGGEMQVFPLKHAPAVEVSSTIERFLNGRGGLAPNVSVTANPRTNSLIVHASPRDMAEVTGLIQRLDVESSASVNKAKMVRLKNSLATNVAQTITAAISAARGGGSGRRSAALEMLLVQPDGREVITSGLLENVTLTPDTRTNSIFITGPAESLELVERLIAQLDESPAASAQIKIFQITNSDASDLVNVLRSLFPEGGSSSVPQLATAEDETSMVPVRFSVDIRTNTIIATGTSGDLQIIEALLLRLDQKESQERINKVYRLKNSPATDVAQAVNEFLRSERVVNQAAPGRQNPFQQIEQEVVVVPEPVRNTLIISATPRYFQQIVELVESLDEQPPQVMIQVVLAEVDLNNFHEFGMEVGLQDSLLFDRSLLGDLLTTTVTTSTSTPAGVVTTTADNIIGATNTPGFDFNNNPLGNSGSTQALATRGNVAGQALSHFSLGRLNSDLDYGGLVLSASSENVNVLLRALDESGSMEVLSRPQIMTLDNQQAFIQVGERVPRIVSSQLTQLGQINSLALEDVGLLLGVTPRISPEGNVVMEIDAEKSEVGPEREGIPISVSAEGEIIRSPRVSVTTAQTTVSAASGQTIVIGGLITTSTSSLSRRVPWLGDLPIVGNLFRYDGYTNVRKELLIILTPHVILGQGDAEYLKQVEMARMSWVSADVFEWLDSCPVNSGTVSDDGVPVIYPDKSPNAQSPAIDLAPIPESGETSDGIVMPPPAVPPETTGSLNLPPAGSGVTQVTHKRSSGEKASGSQADYSAQQTDKSKAAGTVSRGRKSNSGKNEGDEKQEQPAPKKRRWLGGFWK